MKNFIIAAFLSVPTFAMAQSDSPKYVAKKAFINDVAVQAEVQKLRGIVLGENALDNLEAVQLSYAGGGYSGSGRGNMLVVQTICTPASWTICTSVSAVVSYEVRPYVVTENKVVAKSVKLVDILPANE